MLQQHDYAIALAMRTLKQVSSSENVVERKFNLVLHSGAPAQIGRRYRN